MGTGVGGIFRNGNLFISEDSELLKKGFCFYKEPVINDRVTQVFESNCSGRIKLIWLAVVSRH